MVPRLDDEIKIRRLTAQVLRYAAQKVEYADLLYERVLRIELQNFLTA